LCVKHEDHYSLFAREIDDEIEKKVDLPFSEIVSRDVGEQFFLDDDVVFFAHEPDNLEKQALWSDHLAEDHDSAEPLELAGIF